MKRYVVAALVLVGIILFFWLTNNNKNSSPQSATTSYSETFTNQDVEIATSEKYIAFTNGVIEKEKDKKILLFFYANWCPTCRPVDAELKVNEDKIPDGAVVIRVNYNDSETDASEKALASKYGVTYQHTFILLDSEGNQVKKWNGGTLKDILTNI